MTILEEFKKNWLINILGIILFIFAFGVLNVNEARYFKHTSVLNEASKEIISISNNEAAVYKTPNYVGKMVHLTGELKIREGLGDSQYNILVQAVKLRKIVEMYQYHEEYTENAFATDENSKRNYYYYKDWSEKVIDSRSFHSMSHQNPLKKPIETKTNIAEKAYINDFEIGEEAKEKFNTWIDVTSDTKPDDIFIKMHSGAYYHTENIFEPEIGDLRIRFQLAGLESEIWTICGQFRKDGVIVPYEKNKRKILLLSKGRLSIDDIFNQEHLSTSKEVWFTRLFGFLLIMFSIISTENINRVAFSRTRFSFLILDNNKKLRSMFKVAALLTITICVFRQSLHYLHIIN